MRLYTNSALPPGGPRTPSHDVRWGGYAYDDADYDASDDIMRKWLNRVCVNSFRIKDLAD